MPTSLEILDTAVKIGLGALITGATTYVATRLKGKQDASLEMKKHSRSVFERLALGFEESASILTKIVMSLPEPHVGEVNERKQAFDGARGLYVGFVETANSVEALATLVGTDNLRAMLDQYSDSASKLYQCLNQPSIDDGKLDTAIQALNNARAAAREGIRIAFDERTI